MVILIKKILFYVVVFIIMGSLFTPPPALSLPSPTQNDVLAPNSLMDQNDIDEKKFKNATQILLNWLSDSSEQVYDYIFIFGCDDLRVFAEAARLYEIGKGRKILAVGGIGRLTIALLDQKEIWSILPSLYPGLNVAALQRVVEECREETDIAVLKEKLRPFGIAESILIKGYIVSLLVKSGKSKEEAERDIITEEKSTNTPENVIMGIGKIHEDHIPSFILLQTPLHQKRAEATFRKNCPYKDINVLSYPVYQFEVEQYTPDALLELAFRAREEFLKILLYGDREIDPDGRITTKGNLSLRLPVPGYVWQAYFIVDTYLRRPSPAKELDEVRNLLLLQQSL